MCSAPPAAPLTVADVPKLAELVAKGSIDPDMLMNPYEGLAVKPDGTPMKFGVSVNHTYAEWCVLAYVMQQELVRRAGGEFNANDPGLEMEKQVA